MLDFITNETTQQAWDRHRSQRETVLVLPGTMRQKFHHRDARRHIIDSVGQENWKGLLRRSSHALSRCTRPEDPDFHRYGGRGIQFRFYTHAEYAITALDLGWTPGCGLTMDRSDNDGHYEPLNMKLSSRGDQVRNREVVAHTTLAGTKISHCDLREMIEAEIGYRLPRRLVKSLVKDGMSGEEVFDAVRERIEER